MKNNTITRLLVYVGKSKKTLFFVFATVLVGNISLLLAPRYIGDAVDLLADGGEGWQNAFVSLLVLIAGLYIVGSFLQWLSARAREARRLPHDQHYRAGCICEAGAAAAVLLRYA